MKRVIVLTSLARFVDFVLVGLVGLVLACVAVTSIGPRLGHPVLVIEGGSMAPSIPVGALVILDGGPAADLRLGEIVAFSASNGTIVTHRISGLPTIDGVPSISTKGDANDAPDAVATPTSAVIGRVARTVPVAGYLVWLLQAPLGAWSVVLLAATLFVLAISLEQLALEAANRVGPTGQAGRPLNAGSLGRLPPGR